MNRPIGVDLFTGAGGMSLGFEQAGFEIAAAIDIDPIHCATHEFNFPYCKTICRSALTIDGAEVEPLSGDNSGYLRAALQGRRRIRF